MKSLIVLLSILIVSTVGCVDLTGIHEIEQTLDSVQVQLDAAVAFQDELRLRAESLEGQAREDALEDIARGDRILQPIDRWVRAGKDHFVKLDGVTNTADVIEITGKEIGGTVGGTAGLITILSTGLIAAVLRARKNRLTGQKVVTSVEGVLTPDDKKKLLPLQGSDVRRLVDEAQGKRLTIL